MEQRLLSMEDVAISQPKKQKKKNSKWSRIRTELTSSRQQSRLLDIITLIYKLLSRLHLNLNS